MIVDKIKIRKFRGFQDIEFKLGRNLTVIAGQNGTQKTTLLGMLSQPFSITDENNPLHGEKPLCGGNYKSAFAEKFKLSENFDKPKNHEWTLTLSKNDEPEFTIESIKRSSSSDEIRFWKKGDRGKGSGYVQVPVIYLSLSRMFPMGEDELLDKSDDVLLSDDEFKFYNFWHNKILLIPDLEMTEASYLSSKQKNTVAANTAYYDWKMNSAGQDNIGKILLAILSFKRLKVTHGDKYLGGVLAIDELDATLYPASQLKLIDAFRKFSSDFDIQIIFTTHSLGILEKTCELQSVPNFSEQIKVIFLEKENLNIVARQGLLFSAIKHKLNVSLEVSKKVKKIPVFFEDDEGKIFLKNVLKRRASKLLFFDFSLGCDNLIELVGKNIPGFKFPDSIVFLDGDVRANNKKVKKLSAMHSILILPGDKSPERLLAEFLINLNDDSVDWEKIYKGYSKQFAFQEYTYKEICADRKKAKEWFSSQKLYWGRGCARVFNLWIENNPGEVQRFLIEFDKKFEKYSKQLSIV